MYHAITTFVSLPLPASHNVWSVTIAFKFTISVCYHLHHYHPRFNSHFPAEPGLASPLMVSLYQKRTFAEKRHRFIFMSKGSLPVQVEKGNQGELANPGLPTNDFASLELPCEFLQCFERRRPWNHLLQLFPKILFWVIQFDLEKEVQLNRHWVRGKSYVPWTSTVEGAGVYMYGRCESSCRQMQLADVRLCHRLTDATDVMSMYWEIHPLCVCIHCVYGLCIVIIIVLLRNECST